MASQDEPLFESNEISGDEDGAEPWVQLLLERHRHLAAFVASPSCAILRIDVIRLLLFPCV
ncbi:MAG: hypothetical protein P8R42_21715 [Candidatus Binatia bacterium]|nr:hypothetical protein [Candidatus Binatia bacterium]